MDILLLVIWVVCGVCAYGYTFAYFQKEFPLIAKRFEKTDRIFATFYTLLGIIGLLILFITGYTKHGIMFRSMHETID
jgi:hypothetical protein